MMFDFQKNIKENEEVRKIDSIVDVSLLLQQ